MASKIDIIEAGPAHVDEIAARMRRADADEVMASGGYSPGEALRLSLAKSAIAKTALFDGRPEVMFGVGDINILTQTGAPWLLATDAVHDNWPGFLRSSLQWREKLIRRYQVLANIVDERNLASIRWLRWLGFSLSDPLPLGKDGALFRIFRLERKADV